MAEAPSEVTFEETMGSIPDESEMEPQVVRGCPDDEEDEEPE